MTGTLHNGDEAVRFIEQIQDPGTKNLVNMAFVHLVKRVHLEKRARPGTDLDMLFVVRLLGGRVDAVVAAGASGAGAHPPPGDLPGQWAEQLGHPNAVSQANDRVRGLVRVGNSLGILPAVPQQVQPDRAVLVVAGEEMGRDAAEQLGGDLGAGAAYDLAEEAPGGETTRGQLPRRRSAHQEGNETLRSAPGAVQDAPQV